MKGTLRKHDKINKVHNNLLYVCLFYEYDDITERRGDIMGDYDKQLEELQEQIAKKKSEEAILEGLRKRQKELEDQLYELECQKQEEQEDVNKLEQSNVMNFIYKVTGQMKELLEEERREAYEALERYETACKELENVKKDIKHHEMELGRVRRSEENYGFILKQKAESLKQGETDEAAQIKRMEERLIQLEEQEKELNEAISAYNTTKYLVEDIMPCLSRAEGWGKWDLLSESKEGEIGKYLNLNKAQEQLERIQKELFQLKPKLNYVQVPEDMHLNFELVIKCLDYLIDNIFIDYAILKEIQQSHSELKRFGEQVGGFLIELNTMLTRNKQAQNRLEGELDRLVRGM